MSKPRSGSTGRGAPPGEERWREADQPQEVRRAARELPASACSGWPHAAVTTTTTRPPRPRPRRRRRPRARPPTAKAAEGGLAEGMYGGPVGFDGRRALPVPARLRGRSRDRGACAAAPGRQGAGHADRPGAELRPAAVREGLPGGRAVARRSCSRKRPGIKIEFVETDPASEYQENLRNASTKNGSFDLVTTRDRGDRRLRRGRAAAAARRVRRRSTSRAGLDPEFGYAGGEPTVDAVQPVQGLDLHASRSTTTRSRTSTARDLIENPEEQAAFEDKYGRPLAFPRDVGAAGRGGRVLHAARTPSTPLYGDVSTLAPFWGAVNWNERFVCSANPNMHLLQRRRVGQRQQRGRRPRVRRAAEVARVARARRAREGLDRPVPDHGRRQRLLPAARSRTRPSSLPGNPDLDTAERRPVHQVATSCRAAIVDGALIRRPVIFYNICYGVNAFADPSRHEAAYLFLQWAGGARVYTFLTFNPGGYQDPHHIYSLDDPYVAGAYKPQPLGQFASIVPRTAPPITLKGGGAYRDSLSEELQKVLTEAADARAGGEGARRTAGTRSRTSRASRSRSRRSRRSSTAFPTVIDTPASSCRSRVSTEVGVAGRPRHA